MDSANTDDRSIIASAPPQLETAATPTGQPNSSYPPSVPTNVIPPVSAPGSAYPSQQSKYFTGSYNRSVYPPTNNYHYGYPPAPYPVTNCPYPVQPPITPYSGTIMTTTAEEDPPSYDIASSASYAAKFPYKSPHGLTDPEIKQCAPSASTTPYIKPHTSYQQISPYPPQASYPPAQNLPYPPITPHHYSVVPMPYPPQIPNQSSIVPTCPQIPVQLSIVPTSQAIGFLPLIGMAAEDRNAPYAPTPIELGKPTVRPTTNFNPTKDAKELSNALQLESPDKDILIKILCHRSLEQRLVIANTYHELMDRTLASEFETKLFDNFKKIMLSLITPLVDYYLQELLNSLEHYDHDSVIDIMCLLSNYEMYTLKQMYLSKYGTTFETLIKSKTTVHLQRLLLALCDCNRDETDITNLEEAYYEAGQLGLQEDPYNSENVFYYDGVFTKHNFKQIKLICEEYQRIAGESIEKSIKSKFIIDDKQGYLCIVRYSQDKLGFFAKRLHRSMAGLGTNDNQLIRLIVTRSEIDLEDIKHKFQKKFGKSLRNWIKGDTSGSYKYCLYELIGEQRTNK